MHIKIDIDDEELRTIESGLSRLREIMEEAENIVAKIRLTTYFDLQTALPAETIKTTASVYEELEEND